MAKVKIQVVEKKLGVFDEICIVLGIVVICAALVFVVGIVGIAVYNTIDNNSKLERVLQYQYQDFAERNKPRELPNSTGNVYTVTKEGNVCIGR